LSLASITGLGLVCSAGSDVVTAAAAVRAGIARRRPLADLTTYDPLNIEAPVMAAPAGHLSDGFVQTGAWLRLALKAIEDIIRYGQLPPATDGQFWGKTSIVCVTPELTYDRFMWPEDQVPQILDLWLGRRLCALAPLPVSGPARFVSVGASGTAVAIQQLALQPSVPYDRLILLAVDSWLDGLSLACLSGEERLKTEEQPIGLCPSEAAACVLLEREASAKARRVHAEATLLAATAIAPPARPDPEDSEGFVAARTASFRDLGDNLVTATEQALNTSRLPLPFRGDVYLDMNGEDWRALLWGYAQGKLLQRIDWNASRQHMPAIQLGDVGAASGLAAACLATRSFVRDYAAGSSALVLSVSDSGHVGAMVFGKPQNR
jgi:3-oxoacyl-[acyl-carrier-protein] synthase I